MPSPNALPAVVSGGALRPSLMLLCGQINARLRWFFVPLTGGSSSRHASRQPSLQAKSVNMGVVGNQEHLALCHRGLVEMHPVRQQLAAGIEFLTAHGVQANQHHAGNRGGAEFGKAVYGFWRFAIARLAMAFRILGMLDS